VSVSYIRRPRFDHRLGHVAFVVEKHGAGVSSRKLHIHPSPGAGTIGSLVDSVSPLTPSRNKVYKKTLSYNSVSSTVFCRGPGFRDVKIRKLY
jgi:hypothetical protein